MQLLIRLIKIIWLLFRYIPISKTLPSLNDTDKKKKIQQFHHAMAKIIGMNVVVSGKPTHEPCLVISNHISWHDVFAIGMYMQPDFVAKAEVRKWPVIGLLAERAGTLFINRSSRASALTISRTISDQLKNRSVLIFPESTTSLGSTILPFKRRLFQSAYNAKCLIQPIALHYEGVDKNGQLLGYGDESFLTHAIRTLSTKAFTVHVCFCEPFMPFGNHIRESTIEAESRVREAKNKIERKLDSVK